MREIKLMKGRKVHELLIFTLLFGYFITIYSEAQYMTEL